MLWTKGTAWEICSNSFSGDSPLCGSLLSKTSRFPILLSLCLSCTVNSALRVQELLMRNCMSKEVTTSKSHKYISSYMLIATENIHFSLQLSAHLGLKKLQDPQLVIVHLPQFTPPSFHWLLRHDLPLCLCCSGHGGPTVSGRGHRGHHVIGGTASHLWAFWGRHTRGGSSSGHAGARQHSASCCHGNQRNATVRGGPGPAGHRGDRQRQSLTRPIPADARLDVTLADIRSRAPGANQLLSPVCLAAAGRDWATGWFRKRWERWRDQNKQVNLQSQYDALWHLICNHLPAALHYFAPFLNITYISNIVLSCHSQGQIPLFL